MSFFPEISKIQYEGPKSKNPLAFKHYNPDEIVEINGWILRRSDLA